MKTNYLGIIYKYWEKINGINNLVIGWDEDKLAKNYLEMPNESKIIKNAAMMVIEDLKRNPIKELSND